MNKNILIGGAWPYANSSLHLGHISSLLAGDVIARYHRQIGDNVIYVSGTDCHGTPITQRAEKEGISPREITEKYHEEFSLSFEKMQFSYDLYGKTDSEFHKQEVIKLFKKMYDNGYIYEKIEPNFYCEKCNKFLADREMKVVCTECKNETTGEQCDCGHNPNHEELKNSLCSKCNTKVSLKDDKNLYIALSKLQQKIEEYVNNNKSKWRKNAQNETDKYLKQGLLDRAVTRDLNWGVEIPVEGYENKRMYVWIEAVLGYYTTSKQYCEQHNLDLSNWWIENENSKMYMVHGKDNIVFHSLILPGLLLSLENNSKLPDIIVSAEFLNFNDQKFSKSKGIGLTVLEAVQQFDVNTMRFYLMKNGPEKKDTNFTVDDYTVTHNEVTNKLGNFINRTLKYKGITVIPNGNMDKHFEEKLRDFYKKEAELMEKLDFKEVCMNIMSLLDEANKYYDERKPWVQNKEDIEGFNNTIFTCTTIIANISNYINPFMPEISKKIRGYLNISKESWEYNEAQQGTELNNIEPLFTRM